MLASCMQPQALLLKHRHAACPEMAPLKSFWGPMKSRAIESRFSLDCIPRTLAVPSRAANAFDGSQVTTGYGAHNCGCVSTYLYKHLNFQLPGKQSYRRLTYHAMGSAVRVVGDDGQ